MNIFFFSDCDWNNNRRERKFLLIGKWNIANSFFFLGEEIFLLAWKKWEGKELSHWKWKLSCGWMNRYLQRILSFRFEKYIREVYFKFYDLWHFPLHFFHHFVIWFLKNLNIPPVFIQNSLYDSFAIQFLLKFSLFKNWKSFYYSNNRIDRTKTN